ncbi:hypothetical protein QL285_045296 [Trifolium repens]|nr:hypothetical protein QL285_045296 [Trifolium repens]
MCVLYLGNGSWYHWKCMGVVEKRRKWRYNNDALYCHSSPREQEHSPRRAGCCVILAEHWREAAGACGKAAGACGKAAGACGKAAGACGSLQQGAATPREILFQARIQARGLRQFCMNSLQRVVGERSWRAGFWADETCHGELLLATAS